MSLRAYQHKVRALGLDRDPEFALRRKAGLAYQRSINACPCGKRCYASDSDANTAAGAIAKRCGRHAKAYRCAMCGKYHVTSTYDSDGKPRKTWRLADARREYAAEQTAPDYGFDYLEGV